MRLANRTIQPPGDCKTQHDVVSGGACRCPDTGMLRAIAGTRGRCRSTADEGVPMQPRTMPGPRKRWSRALGVSLAIVLGLALWLWVEGGEGRAIRALPAAERARLYAQTESTLESVCQRSMDPGLRGYCS